MLILKEINQERYSIKKKPLISSLKEDKPRREQEFYLKKIMDFIALEADANRYMNLEILDKIVSFWDHTVSLDKTQPKKEEPIYAIKKKQLPTTHRSSQAEPADICLINREHSIESTKPQEKIIKSYNYSQEASDKPQEKAEYEIKP